MTDVAHLHVTHGAKLGPKLGPFPAVVWVLIVGAALYVAHRRSSAAAAAPASSSSSSSPDPTAGSSSDVPYGTSSDVPAQYDPASGATGTDSAASGLTTTDTAGSALTDNLSWQSAAIRALVKAGVTPITANNAVDKYLGGQQLTPDEAAAVNRAITLVGPPPEGAPPVTVEPAAAAPTPAAPAAAPRPSRTPAPTRPHATRTTPKASNTAPRPTRRAGGRVTVHSGDTLTGIAASHHVSEPALYARNRSTIEAAARAHGRSSSSSGHWIYPGTVLELP